MKKLLIAIGFVASFSIMSSAQVRLGNNFEIGGGYNFSSSRYLNGYKQKLAGPGAYFEYRYEDDSHFYVGCQLDYKFARGDGYDYVTELPTPETDHHHFCLEGLFGYTFLPMCLANPFVGLGGGLGCVYMRRVNNGADSACFSWMITPRVGVQVWRFRFTFDFDFLCDRIRRDYYRYGSSGGTLSVYSTVVSLNLGYNF